ncbi:RmlC-like cupins superfamily protein [Euphorbia peplus]|nr:RmlC-like cupins superfamily protein [Euphorbia peplus]
MILSIFVILYPFLSCSSYAAVQDICVADKDAAINPAGFGCKAPTTTYTADFKYSGLDTPADFSNITKSSFTPAFVDNLPGLNGLGLSMGRFDLHVGGFFPLHTHPEAAEVFVVTSGSVTAGFISTDNVVRMTDLKAGDVFVIPPGLLHFVINKGDSPVNGYVSFNSPKPAIQLLATALFGNSMLTSLLAKVSFLDDAQISKLKTVFGRGNH